ESLDGFDLRLLLTPRLLERTRTCLAPERWEYTNRVIIAEGPMQSRLKPGVAIQVLRECLAALAALHREGIVHGDLKPSNIMVKRTGNTKLIDIGSAIDLNSPSARRMWSPAYAAPEDFESQLLFSRKSTTKHPRTWGLGPRRCSRMAVSEQPESSRASPRIGMVEKARSSW